MKKKTWNDIYKKGDFAPGLNPSDFVKESIIGVPVTAGPILDVGCGLGRHLIYLASNGYEVYGIDDSPVAVQKAKENLQKFDLAGSIEKAKMWDIPFNDILFAGILAIYVLNHAMQSEIERAVKAIASQMIRNGFFLCTLVTTNDYRRCGEQVGTNTFICNKGPETGVLHTFSDTQTVKELFDEMFIIDKLEIESKELTIENDQRVLHEAFQIKALRK